MPILKTDPDLVSYADQIAEEYGHANDAASLVLINQYMQLFAEKSLTSPYLFRLYVKRAYAQYVHGLHAEDKDYREEDEYVFNRFAAKNFEASIDDLTKEIVRVEGQALSAAVSIGQMTNVIPSVSPAGRFPASSPSLIGGPDAPRWFRR